jgi:hypothetical protein
VDEQIGQPAGEHLPRLVTRADRPHLAGLERVPALRHVAREQPRDGAPVHDDRRERDVALAQLVEPAREEVALVEPLDLPLVAPPIRQARLHVHRGRGL